MSPLAPDPRRVGMFGGAFDPPHAAHRALVEAAVRQLQLERMYVFPTGHAWHKSRVLSPAIHRVAMAQLAFADLPEVVVDGRETLRSGPSYSVDTLRELHAQHPAPNCSWWSGKTRHRPCTAGTNHTRWSSLL